MKRIAIALALSLLAYAPASAYVIHATSFEDGTVVGAVPTYAPAALASGMTFSGGGGLLDNPGSFGYTNSFPNTGSLSYYANHAPNASGTTWGGGTWAGSTSLGGGSGGLTTQADAEANGTVDNPLSYIDLQEGCEFTISASIASDPNDPWMGTDLNLHFELKDDPTAAAFFRTDDSGDATRYSPADLSTTEYITVSETITLDMTNMTGPNGPLVEVVGVFATNRPGGDTDLGTVLLDDWMFEVHDDCIVTVVPEPQSMILILGGLLGLIGYCRRK